MTNTKKTRLEILQGSLEKKTQKFNDKLEQHFEDCKRTNGQPLNDKRDGYKTINRWNKQNDQLHEIKKDIEKTQNAIENEEWKMRVVDSMNEKLPQYILELVQKGELNQWRRYPNTFFVPGVDKGRIVYNLKTGEIMHRYGKQIPKDQIPTFNAMLRKLESLKQS